MGKFKSWKYRSLFTNIATSTCLVGASAGIIFGVSAGTFKVNYVDLTNSTARAAAANGKYSYYSQNISSKWNMDDGWNPNSMTVAGATPGLKSRWKSGENWWAKLHDDAKPFTDGADKMQVDSDHPFGDDKKPISNEAIQARYNYVSMVIDGSTHSTMDRSFNQSLYNGLVNFIKNKRIESNALAQETETDPVGKNCAKSFKPGGDNTTEFLNIFRTVASQYRLTGLAGFNHVTPLNAMGVYGNGEKDPDKFDGGKATNYRVKFDSNNSQFNGAGFLLIDGEVANNQQVASVLFRSDQPGFLAALSTCMYFYNNIETYHDKHQTLSIGAYGGTSIPTVTIYMGGFERGVEFFNEFVLKQGLLGPVELKNYMRGAPTSEYGSEIKQITNIDQLPDLKKLIEASKNKDWIKSILNKGATQCTQAEYESVANALYDEYAVKMIKLGDPATHFSGTFASGDAIGVTKQFLNRGASAIIAVAGPQSLDSAQEIQNQNSKCIVVGVDSAMEEGDYQRTFKSSKYEDKSTGYNNSTPSQKSSIIKFSAVKDMTTVTQKWAQLSAEGKNFDVEGEAGQPDPNKAVCGVGYKTCGNIQNGLISVSWEGWAPMLQALRHTYGYKTDAVGTYSNFDAAWITRATQYVAKHSDLNQTFKNAVLGKDKAGTDIGLDLIQTYDKGSCEGQLYKNYSYLMEILGEILNYYPIEIPNEINIHDSGKTTKDGAVIWEPATGELQSMTILAWLQQNMFYM